MINNSTAEELAALTPQQIDSMDAFGLSATIMKLSKLHVHQPQLYAACVERHLKFAAADSTRHLSNVVYGLCKATPFIR
jgi:hypothetical protein